MHMQAILTGLIDVKERYVNAVGRSRALRLGSALVDRKFTQIPVYCWVIEHPEGTILVDTGLSARINEPGYFPVWQRPFWRSQYRFHIAPETEIGPQLTQKGIPRDSVRWVVLTHTHFDHTDALQHFPYAKFLISRREHDDIYRYRSLHLGFPSKWPNWFHPTIVDYVPEPIGPFDHSYPLTEAGDVRIVPTPGHTPGHQSLIVQHEGLSFFFGGDTSFDLGSLLMGRIDAPSVNAQEVFETRRRILDYAQDVPLIYQATHDHESPRRLIQRLPISSDAAEAHATPLDTQAEDAQAL